MTAKASLVLALFCLCSAAYGLRVDYPWTVYLTPSLQPGSDYEGQVELLVVFQDQTQHSVILPSTKYYSGVDKDFQLQLTSAGPVEALYLRTKGFCPLGLLPNDLLRLSKIELVSRSTKTAYIKEVNDLAIKDSCQVTSQGTQITDFNAQVVTDCIVDGVRHQHGERFEVGCVSRCDCYNGSMACVPMCGVMAWEPEKKCHFVHMPSQCCDDVVCEEDPKTKLCEEARPGKVVTEDNKAVRRFPWSLLYCINEKCSQINGGIVVGERHILTYAPDLSYLTQLYIAPNQYIVDQANISEFTLSRMANVTAHPDFINQNSPIADSASRLQVVELSEPLTFDKFFQPANLPFDNEHCQMLSKDDCPIMTVGWDRTDDQDDEFRQWFLHADRSQRDQSLCQGNSTQSTTQPDQITPKRRGDKRACVGGMVRDDCTGPLAGAVVANAASIDYVVGITDPDAALFKCDHPGTADVLPLCKYVDWVNALTSVSNF